MCPYEHGQDHIVVPGGREEQDSRSSFDDSRDASHRQDRGRGRSGRARGRGTRGDFSDRRNGRAAFSSAGPNHDRSITSIVVENIPESHFSEDAVRDFFQQFGAIDSINMQSYKHLAVVKFSDWGSASRAYDSPKVIFDNRFVKVYWYKPEAVNQQTAAAVDGAPLEPVQQQDAADDAEMIDPEEFARKQAEAQQAYEEKARKLKEAEAQKEEIQQKIRAAAEERRKLMEKLAAKTAAKAGGSGGAATTGAGSGTTGAVAENGDAPKSDGKTSATDALRAKLAELEAEAEALGVPAEDATPSYYNQQQQYPSYRGRGGYNPYARGAGGFRGRGRGGWRGGAAAPAGGAVARLDNRPRSVEIKALDEGVDFADEKVGEALRVCLFVSLSSCYHHIVCPLPRLGLTHARHRQLANSHP